MLQNSALRRPVSRRTDAHRPSVYALVQVANGNEKDVVHLLNELPEVRRVETIRGPYDLVVHLNTADASPVRAIDGVERVVTLIGSDGFRHRHAASRPTTSTSRTRFDLNPCEATA